MKKNHKRKKYVGEHYSNPQCFKKKPTKLNSQPAQYEKNKIDKNYYRKKFITKEKKHVAKHCSNPQCFKEKKPQLNSQPAQY